MYILVCLFALAVFFMKMKSINELELELELNISSYKFVLSHNSLHRRHNLHRGCQSRFRHPADRIWNVTRADLRWPRRSSALIGYRWSHASSGARDAQAVCRYPFYFWCIACGKQIALVYVFVAVCLFLFLSLSFSLSLSFPSFNFLFSYTCICISSFLQSFSLHLSLLSLFLDLSLALPVCMSVSSLILYSLPLSLFFSLWYCLICDIS